MKEYVLDASVGVKWSLDEEDSDKAAGFLDLLDRRHIKIIVPELFYCEIGSAFWKAWKSKKIKFEEAIQSVDWILSFRFIRRRDSEFADVALENAMQYKISVYDAIYVSLAETYLAPLITADESLVRVCRAKGFDFIESLKEVKLP